MSYVVLFFMGAFLCNAIPHLAAGLRGEAFPTPFAKPPGRGLSSPVTNVLWGTANVVAGIALSRIETGMAPFLASLLAFVAGWLAIGCYLAVHFGKVRRERS